MNQIHLRRLKKSDAVQIATLANNKKIADNLRDYFPYPYAEKDAIFFIDLTEKENPEQTFGIITEEGELCGIIGLVIQQDVHRFSTEIGYWLGEKFWGKGLASQAVKWIIHYGFNDLKLERIYAGVYEYNVASMKVLEKNGFKKEGIFRNNVFKNEKLYDEHRFAKLRNE